jgi:hypothetical protein
MEVHKARLMVPIFVPLCASFVPWNFWRCVVIGGKWCVSDWIEAHFFCAGWKRFGMNEKGRRSGPCY